MEKSRFFGKNTPLRRAPPGIQIRKRVLLDCQNSLRIRAYDVLKCRATNYKPKAVTDRKLKLKIFNSERKSALSAPPPEI